MAQPTASPDNREQVGAVAVWAAASSASVFVCQAARSKVTALVLGPAGLGALAQVLQVGTVAILPLGILVGPAFVRRVARDLQTDGASSVAGAWTLLVTGSVFAGVIGQCLATILAPSLLPGVAEPAGAVALALVGSISALLVQFPLQILVARVDFRRASLANIIVVLMVTGGVVVGTVAGGMRGQLIGYGLSGLASIPVAWWASRLSIPGLSLRSVRRERRFVKEALGVGGAALAAALAVQFATLAIRSRTKEVLGEVSVGQFQAAWAIGQTYFTIVLSALSTYFFPKFAAAAVSDDVKSEAEEARRFVLAQALPIILIAIAAREPLLSLFFSKAFLPASDLLGLQIAADVLRAFAWVSAGLLLYRGHAAAYVLCEVLSTLVLYVSYWVLSPRLGLQAAGYAYVLTYAIYFPLTAIFAGRVAKAPVPLRWWALAFGCTLGLIIANRMMVDVWPIRVILLCVGAALFFRSPVARGYGRKLMLLLRQSGGSAAGPES